MLLALQDPPPPFADIIRTHFRLKAKYIGAQLDKWLQDDDGVSTDRSNVGGVGVGVPTPGGSRNGMRKHVDELKALLIQLAANGDAAAKQAKSSAMDTD